MIGPRNLSWCSIPVLVRPALLLLLCVANSLATGYYGPTVYLDEGGRRVTGSPEFFWELEVKRLARDFHAPEQFAPVMTTSEADAKDFAAAIEQGAIKPPDAAQASEQHQAARAAIDDEHSASLPDEFVSEFTDYHRGAFAFSRGAEHWEEARQAWEALLARPPHERNYRSVWAAFMLGKVALKKLDPEAAVWFQRTRELARDGFADSLGMAPDSYGWEARSEWKHGHPERAAALYLTQLALGDKSAVISLKALIPDRQPVEGMLNYGPEIEEREKWDDATKRAQDEKELAGLRAAARDPLLRRLVTVHILATQTDPYMYEDTGRPAVRRAPRWLAAIQAAKIGKVPDAEYLGWIAYGDGKYEQAAHWLSLSSGDTPAGLWLKSKLQLRAGKMADATQTMAKAWENLRDASAYTGWEAADADDSENDDFSEGPHWSFEQAASGDLGGLRLARSEFVTALDTFAKANLWSDVAFIAERVLTLDELKKYVDAQPADDADKLRYILGRRLVREDRYADARPYLPPNYAARLDAYVNALQEAASAQRSKEERARAYFAAAWIARFDGMELMGTEGAPDGYISYGASPEPDLAKERQSGNYVQTSYDRDGTHEKRLAISLKPSAKEMERLAKQKIRPDVRFHYRVIAAFLAVRAAELLPDNSEELADVLNCAGGWSQDRDQKLSGRCFNIIERRAARTEIGAAVVAKRWFVRANGPWSAKELAAHEQQNEPEQ